MGTSHRGEMLPGTQVGLCSRKPAAGAQGGGGASDFLGPAIWQHPMLDGRGAGASEYGQLPVSV